MGTDLTQLLLDTHTLLWWWSSENLLTRTVRALILDPGTAVFVSAASAWEIATKVRLGRLAQHGDAVAQFDELLREDDFRPLSVTCRHGLRAGSYPSEHADPFDRIMAAQAELESLTLVTADVAFSQFPVETLW